MKYYFTSLLFFIVCSISAQNEIKISEEMHSFAAGSKNAIVVSIPYTDKDMVEKQIKNELKSWNGKYDSKSDEYFTLQAVSKFMGDKPFDTYAKIISSNEGLFKIAFATDLGGAFLSSRDHNEQFKAMSDKLKTFAKEAAIKSVEAELDKNKDDLSGLEKTQRSYEKDKKNLEEDIEDYKRKIAEAEKKIEENIKNQETQKTFIKSQQEKVSGTEKKLGGLK